MFSWGGSLLPSIYADGCSSDDVIAFRRYYLPFLTNRPEIAASLTDFVEGLLQTGVLWSSSNVQSGWEDGAAAPTGASGLSGMESCYWNHGRSKWLQKTPPTENLLEDTVCCSLLPDPSADVRVSGDVIAFERPGELHGRTSERDRQFAVDAAGGAAVGRLRGKRNRSRESCLAAARSGDSLLPALLD